MRLTAMTMTLAAALLATDARAQVRFQGGFNPPPPGTVRTTVVPGRVVYRFGAKQHMDDLAVTLTRQLKAVCLEMHRDYQGNPGYRETYAEAYEAWQLSEHIHELVHDRYHTTRHDDDHLARDLNELDALFHHVEDDVAHWHRTHGHSHTVHGHGRTYGRSTDLHVLMAQAEQTLHHAMDDYGSRSKYRTYTDNTVPPAPVGVNPPSPGRIGSGNFGNDPRYFPGR
jgi:hypothetical protein